MYCMHCGQQIPSDAVFCPNCGQKAETTSDAPAADIPAPEQTNVTGGAPDKIDSCMNYALVITALALFQCGTYVNLVLGIVAIVFANKADQDIKSGDFEQARNNAKTAKTLCMIATGVIVFQLLAVFFVIALVAMFYLIPFLILLFQ